MCPGTWEALKRKGLRSWPLILYPFEVQCYLILTPELIRPHRQRKDPEGECSKGEGRTWLATLAPQSGLNVSDNCSVADRGNPSLCQKKTLKTMTEPLRRTLILYVQLWATLGEENIHGNRIQISKDVLVMWIRKLSTELYQSQLHHSAAKETRHLKSWNLLMAR